MSSIAVLMSTYNGEKFIAKQLESIAKQTCIADVKLYIRDDGSSDNTELVVDLFKDKIDITFIKGSNKGPARSFWNLLEDDRIKADYYAFCDQDDIWDPDKLEIAVSFLKDNVDLYACNCRSIDSDDHIIEYERRKKAPFISIDALFVSGITQGCAMVFTDNLRNQIRKLKILTIPMHDLIICIYALCYGKLAWDEKPHFSYRFHGNNVVAKDKKNKFINIFDTVAKWKMYNNEMMYVAQELLDNNLYLDSEIQEFLHLVAEYKYSIMSKIKLLLWKNIRKCDIRSLWAFYGKVIINIL